MTEQKDWNGSLFDGFFGKAVEMDHAIDEGAMPLCPLCDNEMLDCEQIGLVTACGAVGLAHAECIARYAK